MTLARALVLLIEAQDLEAEAQRQYGPGATLDDINARLEVVRDRIYGRLAWALLHDRRVIVASDSSAIH